MIWQKNIITGAQQIRELLAATTTIAVLGIKIEAQASQPAFYVPRYLKSAGLTSFKDLIYSLVQLRSFTQSCETLLSTCNRPPYFSA